MIKDNFESLSANKTDIVKRLAFDDKLAKIMINGNPNYKDNTVTQIQNAELINTQIFPRQKIPNTTTDAKSYITMRFRYKASKDTSIFKASYITFYIFCHESISMTAYMTLRYDEMLSCVDRLINDTRGYGWLGKMSLDSMEDVIMDTNGSYLGVSVTYKNTEFQ